MKLVIQAAVAATVLALGASPALAVQPEKKPKIDRSLDAGVEEQVGDDLTEESSEDAEAGEPAIELAPPGEYCKGASKKRVKGQKGTAFSACVKAQARLRSGKAASPGQACKGVSKKRVKGQKGTPFSVCVKAAAQLIEDQLALDEETADEEETLDDEEIVEDDETLEDETTTDPEPVVEG